MSKFIVAITGASGAAYGTAIIKGFTSAGHTVAVTASREGILILRDECGIDISGMDEKKAAGTLASALKLKKGSISFYAEDDLHAPISSGSYATAGMVVAPCSMKTLAGIANGYAENLIERAADVMLKERRPLLIVPRETPLSAIHLENMLKLARLGVHVLPAMPGFYNRPATIQDLINNIAGRALDLMGAENDMYRRWE
ncbi:MAG TPA: flavin prenyltransferase UbiX [Nitrospirota bacterium]|nr:flavin prenyltransferase UbiX [Nitrospirota bacterium]